MLTQDSVLSREKRYARLFSRVALAPSALEKGVFRHTQEALTLEKGVFRHTSLAPSALASFASVSLDTLLSREKRERATPNLSLAPSALEQSSSLAPNHFSSVGDL